MNQFFTGDAATFWPAFAKAQSEFAPLKFNRIGKIKGETKQGKPYEYEYYYADLGAMFDAVRPALAANGFAAFHLTDGANVRAVIAGNGGMLESGALNLSGGNPLTPQQYGGVITYAKRYTLGAVCGLFADADEDAKDMDHQVEQPAPPPPLPAVAIGEAQAIKMFEKYGAAKATVIDGKTFAVWEQPDKNGVLTAYGFNLAGCVDTNPTDLTTAKA